LFAHPSKSIMKLIAAYLLAVLGGNATPDAVAVSKILSSVGVDADQEALKKVVSELNGKKIEDVIAAGNAKLSSVPAGGGGGGGGSAPAAAAPAAAKEDKKAAAAAKEEPKKKKEEEKKEEEEEGGDMGFSLFD